MLPVHPVSPVPRRHAMTQDASLYQRRRPPTTHELASIPWLARLQPWAIAFTAYLLAAFRVGGEVMQLELQVPAAFGPIMEGAILLCVLAGQFFLTYSVSLKPSQLSSRPLRNNLIASITEIAQ